MAKQARLLIASIAVLITCTGCSMVIGGWKDLKRLKTAPRTTWNLITQPGATLSLKEKVVVCSESITEEILGVSSETFTYSVDDLCATVFKAFIARSKPGRAAKISRLVLGDLVTLDGKVNNGMLEINSLSRFKKAKRKKKQPAELMPIVGGIEESGI